MENVKHRTQISLEDWQYQAILELSKKTRQSISSIIRDLLSEKLLSHSADKNKDSLTDIIGIGSGDGKPAARTHDKYLYGRGK